MIIKSNCLFKYLFIGIFITSCQSYNYYDPNKPHRGKDRFHNNYDNSPKPSVLKWKWESWTQNKWPKENYEPEIHKTDLEFLKNNKTINTLTWIGHASVFLQIEGINILIDPVFSERVSPVSFAGPKRKTLVPFEIEDLPPIDFVVISHNHYDHLDLASLKRIYKHSPSTQFFLPLGNKKLVEGEKIQNVFELDWWETKEVGPIEVNFVPGQHWSARSLWDQSKTLWGGWYFKGKDFSFFYPGDTGYSKDFKNIFTRLGGVDFSAIPIGAYEPNWFMKQSHVNPKEAVYIHKDLQSKKSVGIHWGTFKLSDENMWTPKEDLEKEVEMQNLKKDEFIVIKIGETINI